MRRGVIASIAASLALLTWFASTHGTEAGGRATGATFATPLLRSARPSTDASVVMSNLEDSLRSLEERLDNGTARPERRAELADLLMVRAQFLGRPSDAERALKIAEAMVADQRGGSSLLLRARSRAALHLFPQALRDLDDALVAGADGEAVRSARASILQAVGRIDEAVSIRTAQAQDRPNVLTLGSLAVALGEGGQLSEASQAFGRAQSAYRDASPLPLAWLYFQEGKLYFAADHLERARTLFQAAVDHVPTYWAAAGHLAEVEAALGHTAKAIERLRHVGAATEDPDAAGQLCRVLAEDGQASEARACWPRVAARYDALLSRHPEALWDHAAEFFLASGDPIRALDLARKNLALRPTREARDLVARASAASVQSPLSGGS